MNIENVFDISKYNLPDATVVDLTFNGKNPHIGSGNYLHKSNNLEIDITGCTVTKPRLIPDEKRTLMPKVHSGDTARATIIQHDLFDAVAISVTDGLSMASPLWLDRIPLLQGLLAKNEATIDSNLLTLPPDICHAALQEKYYNSPEWQYHLEQLTRSIRETLIYDRKAKGINSDHPYPNTELQLSTSNRKRILDYASYREEALGNLPYILKAASQDHINPQIPPNTFDWYLNAIFSYTLCIIPKLFPTQEGLRNILGNSITSNADTLEILVEELPHKKFSRNKQSYLRLVDPNRQPEKMIARLSKRYSTRSPKKEQFLLEKPQSTYLTYPVQAYLGWLRDYAALSTQWTEISKGVFSYNELVMGGITDGSLYLNRDPERTITEKEFSDRALDIVKDPNVILSSQEVADDGTAVLAKVKTY